MPASSSASLGPHFPRTDKLPSADPVSGLARRPQPSPPDPLGRKPPYCGLYHVPPASPSSDPGCPQLLSLELLLPSFHFRAVPGPEASRLPISGPPVPFPGNPGPPPAPHTCTSGPPLSRFLDALRAPQPTSGAPAAAPSTTPAGLARSEARTPYPGAVRGPPPCGGPRRGDPAAAPPAAHPLPPGAGVPVVSGSLKRLRPSSPSPALPPAPKPPPPPGTGPSRRRTAARR